MAHATRDVWRLKVSGLSCPSTASLVDLRLRALDGVEALSVSDDGEILVVGFPDVDLTDDLLRTTVEAGLDPGVLSVAPFELPQTSRGLSVDEALSLGLVQLPREPVRAELHTVQRVSVRVTDGYDPDRIIVSAGTPVEIEFSEGHGCLGQVVFDGLGLEANLESGGAIVRLPALEAGEYSFRCGMDMVHGILIAE